MIFALSCQEILSIIRKYYSFFYSYKHRGYAVHILLYAKWQRLFCYSKQYCKRHR